MNDQRNKIQSAPVAQGLHTFAKPIGAEAKSKFTVRITEVTIEVKEMKKAEKVEEKKARAEYAQKKAMSD